VLGTLQPWQQVFILIGSPGLALGLLALLLPEPPDVSQKVAKPAQGADGFSAFFRSRAAFFTCHFLGFGGLAIVGFGMISWAPVFAMRHYGLSAGQAGLFIGLIHSVCGIAGYVFHGWFSDRLFAAGIKDIHLRYYIVTYAAGCVIGGMLFAASLPIWMFAIGYGVLGFLQPFSGPAATALQLVTPFRYRARISALFLLAERHRPMPRARHGRGVHRFRIPRSGAGWIFALADVPHRLACRHPAADHRPEARARGPARRGLRMSLSPAGPDRSPDAGMPQNA